MSRKRVWVPAMVLVVLAAGFLLGPRVEVDTTITPPALPDDLDVYLAESEASFSDLEPGTEKTIVWAGEPGEPTDLAVVYLHGFSATRQETAPLSDIVAEDLHANLYYTRYTGHGLPGEALAEATVNDWLNDTWEAYEIGRALGSRVVVIGTSTGGTAAAWLAAQPGTEALAATVLLSPNFGPVDSNAEILTWPWGRQIAEAVTGPERSWEPQNEAHARYWTERYPTRAVLPMMGLVKLARGSDLESIDSPLLVVASPRDQVVDIDRTRAAFDAWGSGGKEMVEVDDPQDPDGHLLAGDILAPDDTGQIRATVIEFISGLDG